MFRLRRLFEDDTISVGLMCFIHDCTSSDVYEPSLLAQGRFLNFSDKLYKVLIFRFPKLFRFEYC